MFLKFQAFRGSSSFFLLLFSLVIAAPQARALTSNNRQDYLNALKIADQYVQRHKGSAAGSVGLSVDVLTTLFGRYYQVGDSWDVAAVHTQSAQMRMTSDPKHLQSSVIATGIFHYRVRDVKTGPDAQAVIEVTQKSEFGHAAVDPAIRVLTLTMTDRLKQSEKSYCCNKAGNSFKVSPEAIHSRTTLLEMFPLDVPDPVTAERQSVSAMPLLPPQLQAIADQIKFSPNLGRSSWFEQDDFFGRPVQFQWQQGDPWPSYVKTASGIAILLRKGTL